MMTDEQLKKLALDAIAQALEGEEGETIVLIGSSGTSGKLFRWNSFEASVREQLGDEWINSRHSKNIVFQAIKAAIKENPPEAFVFASAMYYYTPTEKFTELTIEKQALAFDGSSITYRRQLAKDGYMTLIDGIAGSVQTPTRFCGCIFDRESLDMEYRCEDLCNLHGMMKVFGDSDVNSDLHIFPE